MTKPAAVKFEDINLDTLATLTGRIALCVPADGTLWAAARRLNRLTKGAVERAVKSDRFTKAKEGEVISLAFPMGLEAEALDIVCLTPKSDVLTTRRGGVSLGKIRNGAEMTILAGGATKVAELALGAALRGYDFLDHKTGAGETVARGTITVQCPKPADASEAYVTGAALAEGVFFTRDLVNEPANILTTTEFKNRLLDLKSLGIEVEVLDDAAMEKIGMGALLSVGQGSASPSYTVIMKWNGGTKDDAPLALVGKGVVFDTGGISIKPSQGMEEMTMDMGGAGVVAGVMKSIALRKAKANVIGLVGLVENMPSGTAYRPGDVITSLKGDKVEIISTDAEGRMVLADVLWYAQETYKPKAMIDLATLTGACIIALGHDNAAVYANDDALNDALIKAARTEGEGAWRMPLDASYDEHNRSQIGDVKNSGGRPAGSITAARFLNRFVKEETPWIHIDIAGVAHVKSETRYAPRGATGWGVLTLDRLIRDKFEG